MSENNDRKALRVCIAGWVLMILLHVMAQIVLPLIFGMPQTYDYAIQTFDVCCVLVGAFFFRFLVRGVAWDATLACVLNAAMISLGGLGLIYMRVQAEWWKQVPFLVTFALLWLIASGVMWNWALGFAKQADQPQV